LRTGSREKRKQTGQTARKYFECFKKVIREAQKEGYIAHDPFSGIEIRLNDSKSEFVVLSIDEIQLIQNLKITDPVIMRTRDHFLFQFYCGFYYSDLCNLKWSDIKQDKEFGQYIDGSRFKTSVDYLAPIGLFPRALEILEKQKEFESDYVFPNAIDVHVYNRQLKKLATEAGIEKNISNKIARRSMIQFLQSQGLEPQFAQRMAGHTKFSTTEQYFKLGIKEIASRIKDKMDLSKING
jgi:site-specific recombinase XerD